MINHLEVFDDHLNKLKLVVEENRLLNCRRMSSDLTKYSVMVGYQDGVLIAEIFEGIFSQIYDLFTTTDVPENQREQILDELKNHIVSIEKTYKDDDNSEYIDWLTRKISELEEKISELENQNHELFVQSITAQNTESVKELAHIWEIDENTVYDPRKLEGILSKYSDSQNSVEWVRDVRDSS